MAAPPLPPALLSPAPDPLHVDFAQYETVVSQADTGAEVVLVRTESSGPLDVQFTTIAGPGAGANFVPVDTTVHFEPGESAKAVTVPVIPNANNPGEVTVGLRLDPQTTGWATTTSRIDRSLSMPQRRRLGNPPGVLRIVSRPEVIAPQIIATELNRDGLTLSFSEPMDPARAQDRRNYVIRELSVQNDNWVGWMASPFSDHQSTKLENVPIRRATYDAATNSVTLTPARALKSDAQYAVLNGNLRVGRRGPRALPPRALTDLAGNVLDAPSTGATAPIPGSFRYLVPKGRTSPPLT